MELIFDSIEEKNCYIAAHCPAYLGGRELHACGNPMQCKKCWEQSGVKMSIKPDENGYRGGFTYISTNWFDNPLLKRQAQIMMNSIYGAHGDDTPTKRIADQLIRNGYFSKPKFEIDDREPEDIYLCMPRHHGETIARMYANGYFDTDLAVKQRPLQFDKTPYSRLDKLDHYYYHSKAWRETLDIFMDKHDRIKKPQIERVIFNNPATIVFWKDGTKTVVKVREGDRFDPEKGLAMAICKKVLADENGEYWTREFKKWLPKPKTLGDILEEMQTKLRKAFNIPAHITLDAALPKAPTFVWNHNESVPPLATGVKVVVTPVGVVVSEPLTKCHKCKHEDVHEFDEPCRSCNADDSNFESKEEKEEERSCALCKYVHIKISEDPCASCDKPGDRYSKFEKKEKEEEPKHVCKNCKYYAKGLSEYPCRACDVVIRSNKFDHKDAK